MLSASSHLESFFIYRGRGRDHICLKKGDLVNWDVLRRGLLIAAEK